MQLSVLCRELAKYIPNRDELGSVIGYSVVAGLLQQTETSATEQRKWEQTRWIYQKLEGAIDICKSFSGDPTNRGYSLFCSLKVSIDPLLVRPLGDQSSDMLTQRVLDYVSHARGSREDRLRRSGLALLEQIEKEGDLARPVDALTCDYNKIEGNFT